MAQEYDRVEHLPLPGDIRELYFRRTNVDDGRSQQHQRHHYHHQRQRGNAREDIEEEVTGFDGWLRKQGIETTKSSEEGMPRRGGQPKSYTDEATKGLVVAYWSYDYREHAMGHLTRGLFCSHQARMVYLPLTLCTDGEATSQSDALVEDVWVSIHLPCMQAPRHME